MYEYAFAPRPQCQRTATRGKVGEWRHGAWAVSTKRNNYWSALYRRLAARRGKKRATIILDFVFVASSWLRFLGRFEEAKEDLPYAQFLGDFFAFLRDERGLAETTIDGHKRSLKLFLSWLWNKRRSVSDRARRHKRRR